MYHTCWMLSIVQAELDSSGRCIVSVLASGRHSISARIANIITASTLSQQILLVCFISCLSILMSSNNLSKAMLRTWTSSLRMAVPSGYPRRISRILAVRSTFCPNSVHSSIVLGADHQIMGHGTSSCNACIACNACMKSCAALKSASKYCDWL